MPMVPKYSICQGGGAYSSRLGPPRGLCRVCCSAHPLALPFTVLLAFLSLSNASILQDPAWPPLLLGVSPIAPLSPSVLV